jgi:Asp-tRNA(Asn)/Glu-tRNA(Gln) amidotransferase A subunit family amidase
MPGYDLESVKLPKLIGLPLRLFAAALDHKATRALLLPNLLKQGGILGFRTLETDGESTLFPLAAVMEPAAMPLAPEQVDAALSGVPRPGVFSSARDYAAAYREGTATPLDVAERVLAAIAASDAANPPLRAFVANDRDDVLALARASTGRLQAGRPLSMLDGVPVTIKDELGQAPYPTHVGTKFLGTGPATDCFAVARLRAAGALLIGKANMYELGLDPSGFNAHYGTVRNPYNPAHDPGGSSSGPAAAVAAGLSPVALGCDGGGSIRIPASFCGVVGLKPTFERVSEANVIPLTPSLDAIGPIGATVADVALAYGLIAGPDPDDPLSQVQPPVEIAGWDEADLHGLVLGIYTPWFRHAVPGVVAACEAMLQHLVSAGAEVREVEIQGLDAMRLAHTVTIVSDIYSCYAPQLAHWGELAAPTRITLALAHGLTKQDYAKAQQVRTRAIAAFQQALAHVDAIVTPTAAVTAPPIPVGGERDGWSDLSVTVEKMRFAFASNLTGHPAISFPAGYDGGGLPVGMQAIGRYWDERTLLRIASAAEQSLERRRPQVFFPILR